ncbi:hypothetical protein BKA81DRAFT_382827 [Phyllosticta paracitricarpa]
MKFDSFDVEVTIAPMPLHYLSGNALFQSELTTLQQRSDRESASQLTPLTQMRGVVNVDGRDHSRYAIVIKVNKGGGFKLPNGEVLRIAIAIDEEPRYHKYVDKWKVEKCGWALFEEAWDADEESKVVADSFHVVAVTCQRFVKAGCGDNYRPLDDGMRGTPRAFELNVYIWTIGEDRLLHRLPHVALFWRKQTEGRTLLKTKLRPDSRKIREKTRGEKTTMTIAKKTRKRVTSKKKKKKKDSEEETDSHDNSQQGSEGRLQHTIAAPQDRSSSFNRELVLTARDEILSHTRVLASLSCGIRVLALDTCDEGVMVLFEQNLGKDHANNNADEEDEELGLHAAERHVTRGGLRIHVLGIARNQGTVKSHVEDITFPFIHFRGRCAFEPVAVVKKSFRVFWSLES